MEQRVRLEIDAAIATITNDNPAKHNAFDDAMDVRLFEILAELRDSPEVRAVIWRGEGPSWSSGRDVSAIGTNQTGLTHQELMVRGHRGIQQLWDLEAPVIVAVHGWAIGGSFQRALLCDIRIAAEDARFMLPELGHGVIPDTGGMAVLYEMCGHGLVSDMVLTGQDLSPVADALLTARRATARIRENFAISILYNIIAVPVAIAGLATPLLAALAMSASSITVTLNALRLRR